MQRSIIQTINILFQLTTLPIPDDSRFCVDTLQINR